jgi:hypothetical protein
MLIIIYLLYPLAMGLGLAGLFGLRVTPHRSGRALDVSSMDHSRLSSPSRHLPKS